MQAKLVVWLFLGCFSAIIASVPAAEQPLNDAILEKIKTRLPPGWNMSISESNMLIEREGDCWAHFENNINAPVIFLRGRENCQSKPGTKIKAKLTFKKEDRWSHEKLAEARKANAKIYQQLKELPIQCGISQLFNANLSRKGEETFIPKTPEDEKKLKHFNETKEKLEALIIKLPDYNTSKYSLFPLSHEGLSNELHSISPEEISREGYSILETFREVCEK